MRIRQYTVELKSLDIIQAYRVYADRSVELGQICNGEFYRAPDYKTGVTRSEMARCLLMARDWGYDIRKEVL